MSLSIKIHVVQYHFVTYPKIVYTLINVRVMEKLTLKIETDIDGSASDLWIYVTNIFIPSVSHVVVLRIFMCHLKAPTEMIPN